MTHKYLQDAFWRCYLWVPPQKYKMVKIWWKTCMSSRGGTFTMLSSQLGLVWFLIFLLNLQSIDVFIPAMFDILVLNNKIFLENSQQIDALIVWYSFKTWTLSPSCWSQSSPQQPGIQTGKWTCDFYFYLITSMNKSDRYSNGKMNLRMFKFHHLWKSIKICQVLKRENEPAIFSHFTIFEKL